LGTMTESERQRWQEIIVHPYKKDLPMAYSLWDWLHRISDTTAPASLMPLVLRGKLLNKVPEHELVLWFEVIATTCLAPQRQELREQLGNFDQSLTVIPLALLDILNGMENDRNHV